MRGGFGTFGACWRRADRRIRVVTAFIPIGCILLSACHDEALTSDRAESALRTEASQPSPVNDAPPESPPRKYDGLTLDEWKARLKSLGRDVPRAESAVPGLRAIAEDRDVNPEMRSRATVMLGRLGKPGLAAMPTFEKLLKEPPSEKGIPAVWSAKAIALLGPSGRDAAPLLIDVLEDPATLLEAQLACLEALSLIGGHHPKAVPAVVRTLKRAAGRQATADDRVLLMGAVDAVYLIGPGASIAVPELMELLDHTNELVRLKVVQALGAIGTPASPAANSLAEMMIFDESEAISREAAISLVAIGPEAHQLLFHLAQDEEVSVRTCSIEALGTVSPRSAELERILAQALRDDAAAVRLAAAIALTDDASRREEVLQVFSRLITEADRSIRLSAANHLSAMRPDDAEWERLQAEIEESLDRESLRLWQRIERMRAGQD